MRVASFTGANPDMAYPEAFAFVVSLGLCVAVGFVILTLLHSGLGERESVYFTLGFLAGGIVFAWLLGAFDNDYGLPSAGGYVLGLVGWVWITRGVRKEHG